MLQTLFSTLKTGASNDATLETRRRHPRRVADRCVAVIHGRTFPVRDWSLGGVLLQADDRLFGKGQDLDMTIKFKLRNMIVDVAHRGVVVRKTNGKVAFVFDPLSNLVARQFQQVIDDHVADEFARSQA